MSQSLLQQEAAADAKYGFPPGTMAALGQSESSQGANLGTIGNIFQVVPSTAANPGFGLSSIDGNDPDSVGAYLAARQAQAGGSLAGGISLFQGGAAPNTAMSSFLSSQGSGGTGSTLSPTYFPGSTLFGITNPDGTTSTGYALPGSNPTSGPPTQYGSSSGIGTGSGSPLTSIPLLGTGAGASGSGSSASSALNWIEELGIRALLVLVGLVLIAGGLYSAGSRAAAAESGAALARALVR